MVPSAADHGEAAVWRRRGAAVVVAPAAYCSVGPQPARVVPAAADGREPFIPGRRSTQIGLAAPAQDGSVRFEPARQAPAAADGLELRRIVGDRSGCWSGIRRAPLARGRRRGRCEGLPLTDRYVVRPDHAVGADALVVGPQSVGPVDPLPGESVRCACRRDPCPESVQWLAVFGIVPWRPVPQCIDRTVVRKLEVPLRNGLPSLDGDRAVRAHGRQEDDALPSTDEPTDRRFHPRHHQLELLRVLFFVLRWPGRTRRPTGTSCRAHTMWLRPVGRKRPSQRQARSPGGTPGPGSPRSTRGTQYQWRTPLVRVLPTSRADWPGTPGSESQPHERACSRSRRQGATAGPRRVRTRNALTPRAAAPFSRRRASRSERNRLSVLL